MIGFFSLYLQIKTNVVSTDKNVTTHGTVLGCARRKLLESTVIKFKYIDPKSSKKDMKNNENTERIVEINKCAIVTSKSNTHDGILFRHYMELEHVQSTLICDTVIIFVLVQKVVSSKNFKIKSIKRIFPCVCVFVYFYSFFPYLSNIFNIQYLIIIHNL